MARRKGSRVRRGKRRRLGVTSVGYPRPRAPSQIPGYVNAARKRTAAGRPLSMTLQRRRRRRVGKHAAGSHLSYRKHKFGKYGKYTVGLLKQLVVNRIQLRLQGMLRHGAVAAPACPGFHPLISDIRGVAEDSFAPLHVYSLFTVNNQNTGPSNSIPCSWRLKFNADAGPVFEPLAQMDAASVVSTNNGFLYEAADYSNQQNHHKYIRHQWLDIRFLLHGRTHEPTTFDIMIFRINPKYEYIDPIDGGNGLVGEDIQRRKAFWQGMAKTLLLNPICPGGGEAMKGLRMVRKYRYTLQPSSNDNLNDEPVSKVVKIFMKCPARAHDYDLAGAPGHGAENTLFSMNFMQEGLTDTFSNLPPKPQRLFMIIRANNSTWRNDENDIDDEDPVNRANTPSYDIMIRKKIECKR